ncbi:hypothetical protein TrST_g3413 [Triparma strigata]|uniref:Uncharacterized protein n=1 Tax=Triparma strigata TaxID=1606541 RepID=A0A9W7EZB5_9STRA|nr:hypothetical protein TrST_g3413 [Triparma strigata]
MFQTQKPKGKSPSLKNSFSSAISSIVAATRSRKKGDKHPVSRSCLPLTLSRKASMTLGIPVPLPTPRDVAVDDDRPPSPVGAVELGAAFLSQVGGPNHPQKLPCTLCGFKGDGYTCHGCGEGRDYILCEECVEKNCCCVQFYF